MALDTLLGDLKSIKGYVSSAIMNFTGEILVSDSSGGDVDLDVVGATFNDIFRSAHEAAGKVGFSAATEMVIHTPNGVIIMLCTGINADAHLHVITVLAKDGNQALAKMTMEKIGPKAMGELA
jgi:predicted regulator of Ras-like GTPase activity (Roadblock/LC7/MglB family)